MQDNYAVIDLFCGIGGLTHGFVQEGFNVVGGIDFDKTCKFAFEKNNNTKFVHKDISALTAKELKKMFPPNKKKILVGCAPCQPYSIFNRRKGSVKKEQKDSRWRLLNDFAKLIIEVKPEIISMENVPLLKNFKNGKLFDEFVKTLENAGYSITYDIYNAQDYGVPQRRKRLVLLGSLLGEIKMIEATHANSPVTVRDAIGNLPPIEDGEICGHDKLHRSRKLTPISKQRIMATPEGGSWVDWDENLKLACHKEKGGEPYKSVYGRMKWNQVAPTMTTYCIGLNNGRFGHPEQHRPISLREAALFQSFPPNYELIDNSIPFNISNLAKHIGNAVPVLLGKAIALSIKKHITIIHESSNKRRVKPKVEI